MPVIVVLPGIAAVLLLPDLSKPDQAYPQLLSMMPSGIKGLIFAALVAAILSSLASMTNSVATIFTMDIYSQFNKDQTQQHYVKVGRIVSLVALVIAVFTAKPLLGEFDQAFQYIQEFTGFFTPGIVVLFLLGMFWARTTATAALVAAISSAVLSWIFKVTLPEMPFMDRVGLVFLSCLVLAVLVTLAQRQGKHPQAVELRDISFETRPSFNLYSVLITLIVAAFYITWW